MNHLSGLGSKHPKVVGEPRDKALELYKEAIFENPDKDKKYKQLLHTYSWKLRTGKLTPNGFARFLYELGYEMEIKIVKRCGSYQKT